MDNRLSFGNYNLITEEYIISNVKDFVKLT